jgi:hypothetical protein
MDLSHHENRFISLFHRVAGLTLSNGSLCPALFPLNLDVNAGAKRLSNSAQQAQGVALVTRGLKAANLLLRVPRVWPILSVTIWTLCEAQQFARPHPTLPQPSGSVRQSSDPSTGLPNNDQNSFVSSSWIPHRLFPPVIDEGVPEKLTLS